MNILRSTYAIRLLFSSGKNRNNFAVVVGLLTFRLAPQTAKRKWCVSTRNRFSLDNKGDKHNYK